MEENNKHQRSIEVLAEATTLHKWKKQVVAGQRGAEQFTFVADEGTYMPGGEGTAPSASPRICRGLAVRTLMIQMPVFSPCSPGPTPLATSLVPSRNHARLAQRKQKPAGSFSGLVSPLSMMRM